MKWQRPWYQDGRLVGRSRAAAKADVAQLAERVLGKDEVTGPIPVIGSNLRSAGLMAEGELRLAGQLRKVVSPRSEGGPRHGTTQQFG